MTRTSQTNRSLFQYLFFLGPAVLVYTAFMIFPLGDSFRFSLYTEAEDVVSKVFTGFSNYETLFTDERYSERFANAFENNVVFFLINMIVQNGLALLFAALLTLPKLRGKAFYRTVIFLPTLLSFVIVGFIWRLILSPLWGITESAMDLVGLYDYFMPWLGMESTALITISLMSCWQFMGMPMLLFYAAFLNIPEHLSEAAVVDGANQWQVFWKIKLPLILPTLGIVTILTFVGNFNAFDLIYVVKTQLAGPAFSTDILGTFFYRVYFGFQTTPGDQYMGATIAVMMFLIIAVAVSGYLYFIQRRLQRYEF